MPKEMTRRQQTTRLKQIVMEITGSANVRVTCGRGTARHWRHIHADATAEQREQIEKLAVKDNLCGTHWPDSGPGDDPYTPSIRWERAPVFGSKA